MVAKGQNSSSRLHNLFDLLSAHDRPIVATGPVSRQRPSIIPRIMIHRRRIMGSRPTGFDRTSGISSSATELFGYKPEILRHLPHLRRYARALTGSQRIGDEYIRGSLEILLQEPGA